MQLAVHAQHRACSRGCPDRRHLLRRGCLHPAQNAGRAGGQEANEADEADEATGALGQALCRGSGRGWHWRDNTRYFPLPCRYSYVSGATLMRPWAVLPGVEEDKICLGSAHTTPAAPPRLGHHICPRPAPGAALCLNSRRPHRHRPRRSRRRERGPGGNAQPANHSSAKQDLRTQAPSRHTARCGSSAVPAIISRNSFSKRQIGLWQSIVLVSFGRLLQVHGEPTAASSSRKKPLGMIPVCNEVYAQDDLFAR